MELERHLRVAVVGAGPAGFFTAEALLKRDAPRFDVDVLERLPTPFGLVRAGVAPDHQKIKSVTKTFERTAKHERFRFLGNVVVGSQTSEARPDLAAFLALVEQIRQQVAALPARDLAAREQTEAAAELAEAAELAQRKPPPAGRINRALENAREILENGAGAATAAVSIGALVVKAIRMAQSLFR